MFTGTYQHTIDTKGRLSLPANFRKNLVGDLVVVKGFDNCLQLFPQAAYEEFLSTFTAGGSIEPRVRKMRRYFMAGSAPVELDGAGRIRVPQLLREFADLEKGVIVNGDGDHIELWNPESWEAYISDIDVEDLASELVSAGFLA